MIKITKQFLKDIKDVQNLFRSYFSDEYNKGRYHINITICTDKDSWDIEVNNGNSAGDRKLFRNLATLKRNSINIERSVITTKIFDSDAIIKNEEDYGIEKEHFNKTDYIKPIQDFIMPIKLNFKDALSKIVTCKDEELGDAFFEYEKLCELLEEDKSFIKADKKLKELFKIGDGCSSLQSCVLDFNYGKLYQDAMERIFVLSKDKGLMLKETVDKLSAWRKLRWREENEIKKQRLHQRI